MLTDPTTASFESFVARDGARLRRALVARYGVDVGNEVANDALGYAWANWADVSVKVNPTGYLFRVGQSAARRHWRWQRRVELIPVDDRGRLDRYDDGLLAALASLPHNERVAVLLVHGHGYRYDEVAAVLGVRTSAVTNHVHRGLRRLRARMGAAT